jgi:amino acid transporter
VLLLAPFAVFVALGFWRGIALHPVVQWSGPASHSAFSTAILVAMWNYMGWDNASTVAEEVHDPQHTYPRAIIASTGIVALTYILPLAAMALAGLSVSSFETGDWTSAARAMGGPVLGFAVAAGGVITGVGMFNALVMSYSRLPLAMAQDGMLPGIFGKLQKKSRAPWVAILALAAGWAMCLGLGFARLVTLDILLYGASLFLEFVALAVLRFREPELKRPFRVPGGLFGAIAIGIPPMLLLGFSVVRSEHEQIWNMSSFAFGMILIAAGSVVYFINHALKPAGWTTRAETKPQPAA